MHLLFTGKTYVSNETINAAYDYTSREIDLLVKIIFLLTKEKDEAKRTTLRMTYSQIDPDGVAGSEYAEIRTAFIGLAKKPLEIWYKETNQFFISAVVNAVTLQRNSGVILVDIHPKICGIICDVKREFTGVEIESVLKLKSKYAKRIYILMCQFKSTGVRYLSIDDIRSILKLGDKYPNVNDMEKRVIAPALHEINHLTELRVSFEKNRSSRKITDLTFLIALKPEASEVTGDERQREFMRKWGLSKWQIDNACGKLTPGELHQILYHCNINQDKINKNRGGYMWKLLTEAGVPLRQQFHQQTSIPV